MNYQGLIEAAMQAMEHTYSPYSNFPVGAALLLKGGTVVMGTNVENVSFGATNCAERSAIFAAISQGYTKDELKQRCKQWNIRIHRIRIFQLGQHYY
ncbi:MAG: cytidine deaminase, partial [Culicoidibacterales bacterium]